MQALFEFIVPTEGVRFVLANTSVFLTAEQEVATNAGIIYITERFVRIKFWWNRFSCIFIGSYESNFHSPSHFRCCYY